MLWLVAPTCSNAKLSKLCAAAGSAAASQLRGSLQRSSHSAARLEKWQAALQAQQGRFKPL
jgi:hypothetical protein